MVSGSSSVCPVLSAVVDPGNAGVLDDCVWFGDFVSFDEMGESDSKDLNESLSEEGYSSSSPLLGAMM